jgi:hypothetical protein
MPRFDGTGPMGQGPMTGGGFGYCGAGSRARTTWGFGRGRGAGRGFGAGFGRGRGFGRGFGWQAFPSARGPWHGPANRGAYAMDPKEEVGMLRDEADSLQAELDSINRRIQELESQPPAP